MTQSERIKLIRNAHQAVLKAQGAFINELLPTTREDVEDEIEQLDSIEQPVDLDDESEVHIETLSPAMRELYSWNTPKVATARFLNNSRNAPTSKRFEQRQVDIWY